MSIVTIPPKPSWWDRHIFVHIQHFHEPMEQENTLFEKYYVNPFLDIVTILYP